MRYIILGILIGCFGGSLSAQSLNSSMGKISYKNSQNVYVKFETTKNINPGDTLYIQKEKAVVPVLIVTNLSSTSCVCKPISDVELVVSMNVIAKIKSVNAIIDPEPEINSVQAENKADSLYGIIDNKTDIGPKKQKISGSIAASSYSNFSSNNSTNSSRYRYLLSLNVRNIKESNFSMESYVSFRHEKDEWNLVQDNIFQALKIYNLSVKYDDKKNQLIFGRKINNKISSIGAVDGIQYERQLKSLSLGLIAGSRPDYTDYSIDFNLPQIAAYVSHTYSAPLGEMQNSFAFVEQMNNMKTDRRFLYFQHSNTLLKNLNLFSTVELDLYKKINGKSENTLSMSSTYISLNYKLLKRLRLTTSYDNRKNIIYYESYKSYINQILEIEACQGLSFQANYYTLNNLSFGIKTGYRFPNANSRESKNIYGYFSYNNIPYVKLSSILAVNYLETSYVNGKILNYNISREFSQGKLYTELGYQWVNYSFFGSETNTIQNIFNASLNWRFYKTFSFTVNYEETFEKTDQYSRLAFQIRKRF